MARIRVAVIAGAYEPRLDGVADYTARLVAELRDHDVDAEVVARQPRAAWALRGVRRAARAAVGADVVHVQFAPSAFGWHGQVGLLPLLVDSGAAVVTTLHEYGWWSWPAGVPARLWHEAERRGLWDRETALLVPRSAALIVTNQAHERILEERFPGAAARTWQVPIGGNVAIAGSPAPAASDKGTPTLVFFGFVHPVKGMPYLLDAVALLPAHGRAVRLELVGGFTSLALPQHEAAAYRREVEQMIADRDLAGAVEITGWVPPREVSRRLSAASVAVFPFTAGVTRKSGSLLSALEHGLPTVATAAAVPDPGLRDGEQVLLVPRRDGEAIAGAVCRILDDPGLAERLGRGGRLLAGAASWGAAADRHLEVYRAVARGAGTLVRQS